MWGNAEKAAEKKNKSTAVLIVITVVMLVFTGLASLWIVTKKNENKTAYIYQQDKLIYTIDLNRVEESYRITIEGNDGCENIIEVRHGEIGIISADCPDKVCVDMGFIGDGLVPVVCVPNGIMIVVKSDGGDVDAKV